MNAVVKVLLALLVFAALMAWPALLDHLYVFLKHFDVSILTLIY